VRHYERDRRVGEREIQTARAERTTGDRLRERKSERQR
jgi:hypothetical protein